MATYDYVQLGSGNVGPRPFDDGADDNHGRFLLIDPRSEFGTGNVFDDLLEEAELLHGGYDGIVIRHEPQLTLQPDPAFTAIKRQVVSHFARETQVYGLAAHITNGKAVPPRLTAWSKKHTPPVRPSLFSLRRFEIAAIAEARDAVLGLGSNEHYEIAGGKHQNQFIRLADLFRRIDDLDRIADWFLGCIRPGTGLIGDTPRLTPLLLAIGNKAAQAGYQRIPITTATPAKTRHLHRQAVWLEERATRVVAVIGCDRAGRNIEETLSRLSLDRSAVVLFEIEPDWEASNLPPTKPKTVVDIFAEYPIPAYTGNGGSCSQCAQRADVTGVNPITDECAPVIRRLPARVRKPEIAINRDFWIDVDETRAASVHSDVHVAGNTSASRRHRPVHIDMARLAQSVRRASSWRQGFSAQWSDVKPNKVVAASGVPGDAVLSALDAVLGRAEQLRFEGTDDSLEPAVAALRLGEHVALIDHSLVSGNMVSSVLRYLESRLGKEAWRRSNIRVFTPLVLSSDAKVEQPIASLLSQPGRDVGIVRWSYADWIPLPSSGTEECPFCFELATLRTRLKRLVRGSEQAQAVAQRITKLEAELDDRHLTWVLDGTYSPEPGDIDGSQPASVYIEDSFFERPIHRVTGYAAFASHLTSMTMGCRGVTPLDPGAFLDLPHVAGNWFGGAFIAGLLRTANEFDTRYEPAGNDFVEAWNATPSNRRSASEELEWGWAAWCDKLPRAAAHVVLRALETRAQAAPDAPEGLAAAFLADLIRSARASELPPFSSDSVQPRGKPAPMATPADFERQGE